MSGRPKGSRNRVTIAASLAFGDDVTLGELCRRHAPEAFQVALALMRDSKMSGATRAFIVAQIFDRGYGKATQTHWHEGDVKVQHTITDDDRAKALAAFMRRTGYKPQ